MNDGLRGPWGLRLLALGLALLAWFVVSGEKREPSSQRVVDTGVRYGVPDGYLLLERVETATVGVRGPMSRLRNLAPFQVDVFIKVPSVEGTVQVPLGADHVALPSGLELVSIEPNVIELTLDREQTEIVEVIPKLSGEPAAGAVVRGARVIPNQALVRGPASRVRDLESVSTTPVDLTSHALDFEEDVVVLPPDRMITIVEPRVVKVEVELEIPGAERDGRGAD
ncbi:MAG: CdaR family protein [Thermoanaerobaculia bacterium]